MNLEQFKRIRRNMIARAALRMRRSLAQKRIWVERRARAREINPDIDDDSDRFESAGSPDIDLQDLPDV